MAASLGGFFALGVVSFGATYDGLSESGIASSLGLLSSWTTFLKNIHFRNCEDRHFSNEQTENRKFQQNRYRK